VSLLQNYIIKEIQKLKCKFDTSNPIEIIENLKINLWFRYGLGNLKGFYYLTHHQRYIVINADLNERDQLMVAAHELGHDRFHQHLARVSPLKDFMLYDMTSRTEYQANLFASELLIADEEVEECISEDMDYFGLCSTVGFNPQLVTFKLYGMMQRGYKINLPQTPNSTFMKK
jgi:Zn-dependent peptidase ImmA (M78 family)